MGQLKTSYRFGRFELEPAARQLFADGSPVALGARAFDVLLALIERRERVVTKEELLELVWPGLVVEENNLQVQISVLRKLLGAQAVATVPGRGYRFTGEVHAQAAQQGASRAEIDLSLPGKPSIAVLPFTNLSGDPGQEYFTDGVTEDIITELSRFRSLFVIARNSSFTYKGKAVDVRTVSKELGVRYVLEGSIRRVAERIRVTTQLSDGATGTNIWAERYDRVLEDIFAVQEELTRSIVAAIAPEITATEHGKAARRKPENLNAYEIGLRVRADAMAAYFRNDRELRERVIREAREALRIDERNVDAYIALSSAYLQHAHFGSVPDVQEAYREALDAAVHAIELDRSDHAAYVRKGLALSQSAKSDRTHAHGDRFDEGLRDLQHAHALNPNDPLALQGLAWAEAASGDMARALEHAHQALRLNPRDPRAPGAHGILAFVHLVARDYARALDWALLACSEAPNVPPIQAYLIWSYVGLGDIESAKRAYEKWRELLPAEITESRLRGISPIRSPQVRHRFTTFFRIAAGLEDPSAADGLR